MLKDASLLSALKNELGITSQELDSRLSAYLCRAHDDIAEKGINLESNTAEDAQLLIAYAAWLWRKRDSSNGLPQAIQRLFRTWSYNLSQEKKHR